MVLAAGRRSRDHPDRRGSLPGHRGTGDTEASDDHYSLGWERLSWVPPQARSDRGFGDGIEVSFSLLD